MLPSLQCKEERKVLYTNKKYNTNSPKLKRFGLESWVRLSYDGINNFNEMDWLNYPAGTTKNSRFRIPSPNNKLKKASQISKKRKLFSTDTNDLRQRMYMLSRRMQLQTMLERLNFFGKGNPPLLLRLGQLYSRHRQTSQRDNTD